VKTVYSQGNTAAPATKPAAATPSPAQVFVNKADMLYAQKKFQEALTEYDHALALDNSDPMTHYKKGMCYSMLKDNDNAAKAFEKSIELDNQMKQAYANLMKIHKSNDNDSATIALLSKMIKAETDPAKKLESKLQIIKILVDNKDFKKAAIHSKEAIVMSPKDVEVLYYDAEINNALGNYAIAKQSALTATANLSTEDPKVSAKLYYQLGYAYHKLADYAKSKEAFEKANFGPFKNMIMKFQPDYFTNIATCHSMIYDYEEALKFTKEAIKIDPNFAPANLLLGEISENSADQTKAIEYYKKTIKSDPKDVKTYTKLIELLMKSKKYSEVAKLADEALSNDPKNRKIIFMKAIALYETASTAQAIEMMTELLAETTITPMERVSYEFALGLMYKSVQDYEKSKNSLSKAAKGPFAYAAQYEIEDIDTKVRMNN
jgi:tetratricopeptide (TPR) repeat protein